MGIDPNVDEPEWDNELLQAPFRLRGMRIGRSAGACELGATLYEIEPGGAISPYHVHQVARAAFARGPLELRATSTSRVQPLR